MNLNSGRDLPPITAIILNWNRREDTLACIASLYACGYPHLSIMLVDQASRDETSEAVAERFAGVEIIQSGGNLGFSRGMNLGIRHALDAEAENVLLLNNDTIVQPAMLERLTAHIGAGVGILAPAIFYADAPHRIWSTGGGMNSALFEITGNHGREEGLPPGPIDRDFVTGCAMLIPRHLFENVGLFDERFFMYYEDMDFCLRVRAAGYRIVLVPNAVLWHRVSQSSGGANSPGERYHMGLSSGLYFRKHMHGWRIPLIIGYRFLSALQWTGRLATAGKWRSLATYWRGLITGWLLGTTT
jgi:GT2 family glycosyltransferase